MSEQKLLVFIHQLITTSSSQSTAVLSLLELKSILEAQKLDKCLIDLIDAALAGLRSDYDVMRRGATNVSGTDGRFSRLWLDKAVNDAREEAQRSYGRC